MASTRIVCQKCGMNYRAAGLLGTGEGILARCPGCRHTQPLQARSDEPPAPIHTSLAVTAPWSMEDLPAEAFRPPEPQAPVPQEPTPSPPSQEERLFQNIVGQPHLRTPPPLSRRGVYAVACALLGLAALGAWLLRAC